MILQDLNLNYLKVFEMVYRTKNMTKASRELNITQSGVSQQILNLEEVLGFTLFDRVNRKIFATEKAHDLYALVSEQLAGLEENIWKLRGESRMHHGIIRVGMPPEFGYNIIHPLFVKLGKKYPDMTFQIKLGLGAEIQALLLNSGLDFAFVDGDIKNPHLDFKTVFEEKFILCCSEKYYQKNNPQQKITRKYFEQQNFVAYQENHQILNSWFNFHYKLKKPKLHVRAISDDIKTVSNYIISGLGIGVLPDHLFNSLVKKNKLFEFKGNGKELKNPISLIQHSRTPVSNTVKFIMDYLEKNIRVT